MLLLMLAVFFAPAFANTASTSLPACCRRGGAHHCTAVARAFIPDETSFRAATSCPLWHPTVLISSIAALPSSQWLAFGARHEALVNRAQNSDYSSGASSNL